MTAINRSMLFFLLNLAYSTQLPESLKWVKVGNVQHLNILATKNDPILELISNDQMEFTIA